MSALVLEDNPQMQFLLGELLRPLRVARVSNTATVQEAKERCQYGGYAFALVDVGLDGESGLDFVRHVRADPAHPSHRMPMIVISGQGNRATIESARDAGADWFLVKPIRGPDLVDRLKRIFAPPPARPDHTGAVVWKRNSDDTYEV